MRTFTRRALLGGAAGLAVVPALAQERCLHIESALRWAPDRPVRLVSPFPPGGPIDVLNCMLAERLTTSLGQPVVVDAKPGANTILGAALVARAPPDGHTFLITTNETHTHNPALHRQLPYDASRSFAPVTLLSTGTMLLIAPADAPYGDARDFAAWAKALERPVTFGSRGVGSSGHLYGAWLKAHHGLPLQHVPYRGEQPAILDMLCGKLDVTFCGPADARPQFAAGMARAIGATGARRSEAVPDVPSFAEQGFDGLDLSLFLAAWVPAGTSPEAVARLHDGLLCAVREEAVHATMLQQGQTPVLSTPEELMAIVRREAPRWAELIRLADMRAE